MSNEKYIILEAHFNGDEYESFKTGWTIFGSYEDLEKAEARKEKLQKNHKKEWEDILPGVVNMVAYSVVELEEHSTVHLVWNIEEDAPFFDDENSPFGDFLLYGGSRLAADKLALGVVNREIKGTVDEVSSSPGELQELILNEPGIRFVKKTSTIVVNAKTGASAMPALNMLLKKPLYEIRRVRPSDVMELEKELEHVREL